MRPERWKCTLYATFADGQVSALGLVLLEVPRIL